MSDNEDLLGDDLGDHSLADYNLGNEEEDQLLADDFESGSSQNVPTAIASYGESVDSAPVYPVQQMHYTKQRVYHLQPDTGESVVPNITVEVPNPMERATYAPYEPPAYSEHAVPPAIPAASPESPQIVPTEMAPPTFPGGRDRFTSERPVGAQRMPQVRDIPDSLDKVVVSRGGFARGRSNWRNPQFHTRYQNTPYRRNNMQRGNFNQRPSFPPPQKFRPNSPQMRPDMRPNPPLQPDNRPMQPDNRPLQPDNRPDLPPNARPDLHPDLHGDLPEMRPEIRPDMRPEMRPESRPDMPPEMRPDLPQRPEFRPEMRPDIPPLGPEMPDRPMEPFRPMENRPPFRYPNQFRPNMNEPRHFNPNMRPNFEPFPYQRPFRPYPPMREVAPNMNHLPQVTIRHPMPNQMGMPKQEVRMLPVQLPPNLPPGGLQGKKVLINPHFKGNFQPPVEGLTMPAYIPTRIQKSPPLSPTLESKFGPVKDIDDAAERFIAEQRNALARAANRKFPPRKSPQRFVENNTIEIENDLVRSAPPRSEDDDLLRRQEEFINANRAGLRRRMRSPTPPRRSPSPRRSPERTRARVDSTRPPTDEESEYRRRMREQEALRERVTRAKEARRRKNAAAAIKHTQDRDRERLEKEKEIKQADTRTQRETKDNNVIKEPEPISIQPDTTKKSPERERERAKVERERSPVKEEAEVNSTCETLTPPRRIPSPAPLTPPLPIRQEEKRADSDDDLDLILGDIEGILSDDDDRDKEEKKKTEPPKPAVDLRSRLPPKPEKSERSDKSDKSDREKRPSRQKIVFHDKEREKEREDRKRKEKSPPRRTFVTSSTKTEDAEVKKSKSKEKEKSVTPPSRESARPRITFSRKEAEKDQPKPKFSNRRVVLQRQVTQKADSKSVFTRIEVKSDPTKPNPGIFSRAVRTAIGTDKNRIVVKKDEPQIEYESDSDVDEDKLLEEEIGNTALVINLPHGMTDTRLKTLAGNDVQSLNLDKEERSAKITFKTTIAAETFKKKFNNKMVAASRLTVSLR